MQVYFHGSEIVPQDVRMCSTHRLHSWGIVITHDGMTIERHGAWMDRVCTKGLHEYIAFAEAVVAIEPMGIKLEDVVFHTTSEMIRDFAAIMYEKNYVRSGLKASVMHILRMLCSQRFPNCSDEIFEMLLTCLTKSRFKWVKPRNRHVYHARGSYLSKYANRMFRNMEMSFQPFDEWIKDGFVEYDHDGAEYRWYPPFSNTI